jgi:hypothetical protein
MFCTKCGLTVEKTWAHCPSCGTANAEAKASTGAKGTSPAASPEPGNVNSSDDEAVSPNAVTEPATTSTRRGGRNWAITIGVIVAAWLLFQFVIMPALAENAKSAREVEAAAAASATKAAADAAAASATKAAADAAAQAAADAAAAKEALPAAMTVVEAVTSAIYAYCPSSNATQWNQANWFMSSPPANPPVEGYWELYAPSSGGDYIYVHVTPNADGSVVTVTAANNYGQQAFDYWSCPASMDVAVYAGGNN